ncbi:probable prolyl 4-hydroxylase 9 isoform X2 [Ananas comosus]|uniref:Probable prolyl 4-hydroxylase 9 isoform X2 n=1 Tax=Ananas comosus TaxID=4615 RepID=A0A6P5EQH4_ANACO|nr:probable prolyl 4-hydroxylase 9 isoform X2 [Ananas comosus]
MIPFSAAPTKENKGRSLWLLLVRAKLGLPIVVLSFSIFFLVGFFGSTLLSPDASEEAFPRERLTEVNGEVESEWPAMPYGDTGDPRPISIPFQEMNCC